MMTTPDSEQRLEQAFWDNVRRLNRWVWCAAVCCFGLLVSVLAYTILFFLGSPWNARELPSFVVSLGGAGLLLSVSSGFLIAETIGLSRACREANVERLTATVRLIRHKLMCVCIFLLLWVALSFVLPAIG